MRSRAIIPLAIGLALGLFAIKSTMDALKKAKSANVTESVQVVMAAVDIPSTVEIKPEMLKVVKTPRTPLLPHDTITKIEDLEGRVSLKSIPQGSPVLPNMIAPKGTLPGITVRVKEGFRAVSVKIDESSGVGYLVRPNDWVDVLVVMDVRKQGRTDTISRVILQNVQVAAVGQELDDVQGEGSSRHAKTITLLVSEKDVPKLHLAQTRGRITMAMRGAEDSKITDAVAEATESEILGVGGDVQPMPVKQPQGPNDDESAAQPENYVSMPVQVTVVNGGGASGQPDKETTKTFSSKDSMDVVDQEEKTDGRVSSHRSNPRPMSWNNLNRAPTQDADKDENDSTSGSSEDIE